MKAKTWLSGWIFTVGIGLCFICFCVYKVDPYFHYHKPDIESYYYSLTGQRKINNGIVRHFDYDAIITGTSMTENFKTSEMDKIFGCHSVKIPFSGGTYKEVNDHIETALASNSNVKFIVRGLDERMLDDQWDSMRNDLGVYPTYLYDSNPFNDVNYLLNKDILFIKVYNMVRNANQSGFHSGIDSFDNYSRWQDRYTFGKNAVFSKPSQNNNSGKNNELTEEDKAIIKENIEKNVTNTADKHPDVDFYLFYTPYGIAKWNEYKTSGMLKRFLETISYATELIVPHKNIHLYLFNNRTDIITDLNNYKDASHYAEWINSLMLKWMHDGDWLLTEDNYHEALQKQYDFYTTYDYTSLENQEDYEADYYAAALLNQELTGAKPINLLNSKKSDIKINESTAIEKREKITGIKCSYSSAEKNNTKDFMSYAVEGEYPAVKINVSVDKSYKYLTLYAKKDCAFSSAYAYIYDQNGDIVNRYAINASDTEKHQYCFALSPIGGNVTIVLTCVVPENSETSESEYQFTDLFLY